MFPKRGIFFWASVTAMVLTSIALSAMASEKQAFEGQVAVVSGSVITEEDFNREMGIVKRRLLL